MDEPDVASPIARKYLRLHLCSGIGAIRFANILREIGDIDEVLGASAARLASVHRVSRNLAEKVAAQRDSVDVERELDLAAAAGARILCLADDQYPAPLRQISDPPPCLYVRGTIERRDMASLAFVGARHCSRYGVEQAERLAALAAHAGLTVVSGMARGIDSAAHRGALVSDGRTIAVLGCGLRHLYPPESTELADRIVASGALVSELPMDIGPDSKNFPPRNRIIAGLSLGVVVVEAARRSGALISARLANEYNREVFAVPGRIDTPYAEGCHNLLKAGGAKLVTSLEDILDELGDAGAALKSGITQADDAAGPTTIAALTKDETEVLEALGPEPMSMEALCETTTLPPAHVAGALTGLQLKSAVRRVEGELFERSR